MKKHLIYLLLALPLTFTSCSDDDDPVDVTLRPNQAALVYDSEGVWEGLATNNTFSIQDMVFSHEGEISAWGLVWNGFTPARVSTTEIQENWLDHQFQILTGGGMSGVGTPYIVAFWNTQENESTPAEGRSCRIIYQQNPAESPRMFRPLSVYVQNTAYTYYTMVSGNNFSAPLPADGYLRLTAHGVHADDSEATASIYLAQDGEYLTSWTLMDLSGLGDIKELYFTMDGSDSGQWGLNTPSYFALDCLSVRFKL